MRRALPFRRGLWWLGRIVLGVVFIYAAMVKLNAPQEFAASIAAYQLLPPPAINLLALGLPVFELACGLLVLTGFYLRIGVLGILAMLLLFSAALVMAQVRGLAIDCGCFESLSWLDAQPRAALARDGILLVFACILYRLANDGDAARAR